jgi:hypothetical protein
LLISGGRRAVREVIIVDGGSTDRTPAWPMRGGDDHHRLPGRAQLRADTRRAISGCCSR